MKELLRLFDTRLITLSHLLTRASDHFGHDRFLGLRLIDDMMPLGTQVVFTCNQPYNFAQWVGGKEAQNLDSELTTVAAAIELVARTRDAISSIDPSEPGLPESKRLDFGPTRYAELSALEYVYDFLVPNFYFHLVTTYDILRANGVQVGKADYMNHLLGKVREVTAT